MKTQAILAVENSFLIDNMELKQGMNLVPFEEFVVGAGEFIHIGQREAMETDDRFRQLLPYVVITQYDESAEVTRFITYRRGKGVGEARLAGNVSVGFGGHIDLADVMHSDSTINLAATIGQAVSRELQEELVFGGIDSDLALFSVGFVIDESDKVGKVHLGIIMNAQLAPGATAVCAEEELETLEPMTAEELLSSGLPLENWTRIVLEHYVGVTQ